MKRLLTSLLTIALLAALAFGASLYYAAARLGSAAPAEVDIPQGSSVQAIAGKLAEAGVIRATALFKAVVRVKGAAGKLRAGPYEFPAGTTMLAAIDKLERGDVRQWPFTIIEGWTAKEIAAALAGQPFLADEGVPAEFLRLASDKVFMAEVGVSGAPGLEGYLFPDTYFLTRPTTAASLIRRLVARFRDVWSSMGAKSGEAAKLSDEELLTLASVVEKETGDGGERPLVASVFYNRLRDGMPLQSDPTIIYGLKDYDGNIRRSDISNPHPYNTYVHAGLPPGPICNPGRASISAVFNPARSDYLYFVSRKDGTHEFSRTLSDHNQAVRRYQLSN